MSCSAILNRIPYFQVELVKWIMEGKEIYIIGAGVSGLIAAYELEQAGYAPIILEKSASVGGRVKTVDIDGIPLDIGFQVLLDGYPMVQKYLDTSSLRLRKLVPGALIYHGGKSYLIGDPLRQFNLLLPVLFAKVGSFKDKRLILRLNKVLKKKSVENIFETPEQSTKAYLKAFGFSDVIIERFFRPFFTGIFLETELKTSSRMFEFVYKMFGEGYATIPTGGIGAVAEQLKKKLKKTEFRFHTAVQRIDAQTIYFSDEDTLDHKGAIIATDAAPLIPNLSGDSTKWKSCYCFYFAVDRTNIPPETIALVADEGHYSNNLYAFRDKKSKQLILSVTVVKTFDGSQEVLAEIVLNEIQKLTNCKKCEFVHAFHIPKALPDLNDLRTEVEPSSTEIMPNVYIAGDQSLNGSLNAAMYAGQSAAKGLIRREIGIFE